MVCPMSASVWRIPRFTVVLLGEPGRLGESAPVAGEKARIGTYSREWSVVGQRGSGSQPWSAVIIKRSDLPNNGKNGPSKPVNPSREFANPPPSLHIPCQ